MWRNLPDSLSLELEVRLACETMVVAGEDIAEGQRELGQTCSIRIGRKRFPGKIAAIGRKL